MILSNCDCIYFSDVWLLLLLYWTMQSGGLIFRGISYRIIKLARSVAASFHLLKRLTLYGVQMYSRVGCIHIMGFLAEQDGDYKLL